MVKPRHLEYTPQDVIAADVLTGGLLSARGPILIHAAARQAKQDCIMLADRLRDASSMAIGRILLSAYGSKFV